MKPQVRIVPKVSQGSNNPDSSWAKARFRFMKQLAIRFGKLDPTRVLDPVIPNLKYSSIGECVDIFLGGGTGVAPCIQQGDAKPIKGGSIPLVNNPFVFLSCF